MWLRKLKTKARSRPEIPAVASPTFSVSSFKDIQSLCEEEDNNNNNIRNSNRNCNNNSRKSKFSNVFHRVRNATSLLRAFSNQKKVEENVQEQAQTLKSLLHDHKDNGVVSKREDSKKNQILIEEKSNLEVHDVDYKAQESIRTLNLLLHSNKDNEVVLDKKDLGKDQLLIAKTTSIGEVDQDGNAQESNKTLRSLHHGDKDNEVVLEEGDLEKKQFLDEGPKSVREVNDDVNVDVSVDDSVKESIQTLKSLHHGDKDNEVVLELEDSEKNRSLIEEPTAVGDVDVSDVNVDDNRDGVVPIQLPGTETRVVIFFTSLRVVRPTFEACKYARTILQSFPVAIDERDLFMDMRFMKELQSIMGIVEDIVLTLPRVFIGGRYIGGAEEIRQLHEAGELKKYLEGLAPAPIGKCEGCGGHGFILCLECNGSHKCYVDKEGFEPCSGCNENGLIRCPSCSSAPL